jgi:peptidoglycan/LPS O-acetylase OafA/YrhL
VEGHRGFIFFVSAVILSAIIFLDNGSFAMYTIGRTLVYAAFGGVLMLAVFQRTRRQRLSRVTALLAGIGTYSYSIYLWHIAAFWLLVVFNVIFGFKLPLWPSLAVYVAGAVIMGIAASKVVEWPVLRIRDKLIPSRSDALAQDIRSAAEQAERETVKSLVKD